MFTDVAVRESVENRLVVGFVTKRNKDLMRKR